MYQRLLPKFSFIQTFPRTIIGFQTTYCLFAIEYLARLVFNKWCYYNNLYKYNCLDFKASRELLNSIWTRIYTLHIYYHLWFVPVVFRFTLNPYINMQFLIWTVSRELSSFHITHVTLMLKFAKYLWKRVWNLILLFYQCHHWNSDIFFILTFCRWACVYNKNYIDILVLFDIGHQM